MMEITDKQLLELGFWNISNFTSEPDEKHWLLDIGGHGFGLHYIPSRLIPWSLNYSYNEQPIGITNIEELKTLIKILGGGRKE